LRRVVRSCGEGYGIVGELSLASDARSPGMRALEEARIG
jgi:hypothetical protein